MLEIRDANVKVGSIHIYGDELMPEQELAKMLRRFDNGIFLAPQHAKGMLGVLNLSRQTYGKPMQEKMTVNLKQKCVATGKPIYNDQAMLQYVRGMAHATALQATDEVAAWPQVKMPWIIEANQYAENAIPESLGPSIQNEAGKFVAILNGKTERYFIAISLLNAKSKPIAEIDKTARIVLAAFLTSLERSPLATNDQTLSKAIDRVFELCSFQCQAEYGIESVLKSVVEASKELPLEAEKTALQWLGKSVTY